MANILSIDFDIIMQPDIQLYNYNISKNTNSVDDMINKYPMLSACRVNFDIYSKIVLFLMEIVNTIDIDNIRIAYSHDDIKNLLNSCEDGNIVYNIDHHHDLGYPHRNKCDETNWAGYFLNNNKIKKYIWLNNKNSEYGQNELSDDRIKIIEFNKINDLKSFFPSFDKLFICLSPEWIVKDYKKLFFLLLDLINQKKQCRLKIH